MYQLAMLALALVLVLVLALWPPPVAALCSQQAMYMTWMAAAKVVLWARLR